MGASYRRPLITAALLALAAALLALALAGEARAASRVNGSIDDRKGPINWTADAVDLDTQSHQGTWRGHVQVTQGDITVAADKAEATGIDSPDMRWVFSGNVRMKSEQRGELNSDRATVEFRDKLLAHAVVTGTPATFQQTAPTNGILARGHAGVIDYDVAQGIVQLRDHAWLTNGPDQTSAATITYDVRRKKVQSEGDASSGPEHSIIVPKPDPNSNSKKPPEPKP